MSTAEMNPTFADDKPSHVEQEENITAADSTLPADTDDKPTQFIYPPMTMKRRWQIENEKKEFDALLAKMRLNAALTKSTMEEWVSGDDHFTMICRTTAESYVSTGFHINCDYLRTPEGRASYARQMEDAKKRLKDEGRC